MLKKEELFYICRKLEECFDIASFFRDLEVFVDKLGYYQFLYTAIPTSYKVNKEDIPLYHTSFDKSWMEYYEDRGYLADDSVLAHCLTARTDPKLWLPESRSPTLTLAQRKVMDEAAEAGLRYGLTLPIHNCLGIIGVLTLSYDGPGRQFESFYEDRIADTTLFGYALHEALQRRFSSHYILPLAPTLTIKEQEVLNWMARGLNYEQIADKQRVGTSTIRKQISRILEKLNAKNSTHACALALQWGLIY